MLRVFIGVGIGIFLTLHFYEQVSFVYQALYDFCMGILGQAKP